MSRLLEVGNVPGSVKVVVAAVVGLVGGMATTALALGSVEFAIFGGIGGAVASMIAALSQTEAAEV